MTGPRSVVVVCAFLGLVLVVGTTNAAAQADADEEYDKILPFIGHWDSDVVVPDGQDRGNCGGRMGDYGEKLLNCSLPVDQLPLNSRGEAWLKYVDIFQSPTTAECSQLGLPALLTDGAFISASPGRVEMQHPTNNYVTRTVWMNGGGPRPLTGQLFQHGFSIGHFDGDDFVIETDHFTFDPDGIDDHLHMASSVRKKVTERYQLIDDEHLRIVITLEDPTFLSRPFTWAILWSKKQGGPPPAWRSCDADAARRELEFAYPGNKYSDKK
jgi:hypothetical protein